MKDPPKVRHSEKSESVSCSIVSLFVTPWTIAPPGSSVHGILQARIMEWAAIPFSGDLPNPGIKPRSPALQAGSLPPEPLGKHTELTSKSVLFSKSITWWQMEHDSCGAGGHFDSSNIY